MAFLENVRDRLEFRQRGCIQLGLGQAMETYGYLKGLQLRYGNVRSDAQD